MKRWSISWTTKDLETHADTFEFERLSDALRAIGENVIAVTAFESIGKNMIVEIGDTVSVNRKNKTIKGEVLEITSVEKTPRDTFIELTIKQNNDDEDVVLVRTHMSKVSPV